MIHFDVTKSGPARHRSGLMRVSTRLRECLGDAAAEAVWDSRRRRLAPAGGVELRPNDWFLTAELFSEEERPGFTAFLRSGRGRRAAIFHDAIPLRHPHITWPQSVARHPGYMKLLAGFDRVWAVSADSRRDLLGFWRWQGVSVPPPVDVLPLGADFGGMPRSAGHPGAQPARLVCLGILEPRKNQDFLLSVCEDLWNEGREFELHLIGRVNPHFGRPIAARVRRLQRARAGRLFFHEGAGDAVVRRLLATARATVFPTLAEGCGLPLLESLWAGVPCVCSDLPVLRENADGGGCLPVAPNDAAAWKTGLRRILTDDLLHGELREAAATRPLPTWADAAQLVRRALA